eukprot:scaffold67843_cov45-Phaeocystis_antarctica.AAC.2
MGCGGQGSGARMATACLGRWSYTRTLPRALFVPCPFPCLFFVCSCVRRKIPYLQGYFYCDRKIQPTTCAHPQFTHRHWCVSRPRGHSTMRAAAS